MTNDIKKWKISTQRLGDKGIEYHDGWLCPKCGLWWDKYDGNPPARCPAPGCGIELDFAAEDLKTINHKGKKIAELIAELQKFPQDAYVEILCQYDSGLCAAGGMVTDVYLNDNGIVILDSDEDD